MSQALSQHHYDFLQQKRDVLPQGDNPLLRSEESSLHNREASLRDSARDESRTDGPQTETAVQPAPPSSSLPPLTQSHQRGASLNADQMTPEQMHSAIAFFNRTSEQLAKTYALLESKVAQLTRELDEVSALKEQELENKKRLATRMQALLDFLPGGVIVLDHRGIVVQSNPAARTLLGHDLDGKVWRDLIQACFLPRHDDGLDVSTRDGRRLNVATASLDEEGQIILLTDQTETRRLQAQVSRHEKLSSMGKMVSALAHQIRTPLSAAILYANHLCTETIAEDRRKVFAGKLLGRLNHMAEQVKDMLLFVRNELPLNDEITLADLEQGLRAAMEVPLVTSKSRCGWQNVIPQLSLRCNREALIGALLNLVNNSIQANPQGAKLKISFCRTALKGEPAVAIAIADNGPGMSDEQLSAAQEMFYTTKPQGTGLGLAVVKSVALAHGGEFKLRSRLGVGTCGVLTIPLAEAFHTRQGV